MDLPLVYAAALLLVAMLTLMVGVTNDLKEREVNSYLFVPLFLVSLVLYAAFNFGPVFLGISSAFFLLTFFNLKPLPYGVAGVMLFVIGFIFGPTEYLMYFMVLFVMYIIGTGEKYYGIGDIKAFLSISFASISPLPFLVGTAQSPIASLIPFNFMLLVNTAIMSVLFVPYLVILNYRKKKRFRAHYLYALDYDEQMYKEHPERYRIVEHSEGKIMVYGAPSLVAIYLGFMLSLALGPWFLYL